LPILIGFPFVFGRAVAAVVEYIMTIGWQSRNLRNKQANIFDPNKERVDRYNKMNNNNNN
jgi:hypothetical protein